MAETVQKYRLCRTCVERQAGDVADFQVVPDDDCFICGGLTARVEAVAEDAAVRAESYEFKTFVVGLSLPEGVQEREDEVRSAFKLKGKQTIKTQLSAIIGARVAGKLRKKLDKSRLDLTILIDLANSLIRIQSRSLFFFGRYTKPRGVFQRRERCSECLGRGCEACQQTGLDPTPSVEEKVGRKLVAATRAEGARFETAVQPARNAPAPVISNPTSERRRDSMAAGSSPLTIGGTTDLLAAALSAGS